MANEHDERIAQIKARLDAVTPGAKEAGKSNHNTPLVWIETEDPGYVRPFAVCKESADATFIANAPVDIDYLLNRIAKLEAQLDAARDRVAALLEGRRG